MQSAGGEVSECGGRITLPPLSRWPEPPVRAQMASLFKLSLQCPSCSGNFWIRPCSDAPSAKLWRSSHTGHTTLYISAGNTRAQKLLRENVATYAPYSFVEEHLRSHGVEIREHGAVRCICGHVVRGGDSAQAYCPRRYKCRVSGVRGTPQFGRRRIRARTKSRNCRKKLGHGRRRLKSDAI